MDKILNLLFENRDEKFADFQSRLLPTVDRNKIIGVRTPIIRSIAKDLLKDKDFCSDGLHEFLSELPHKYFDEDVLHGELISREKDFEKTLGLLEAFLPYIDNWAVCDLLSPKCFAKHKAQLIPRLKEWLQSDGIYTARFAINAFIKHFLDDEFDEEHLRLVSEAAGDDYYIRMAKAWYLSFALIKQYETTLSFIKSFPLDKWTYNKALQKARESHRLSDEQKECLKSIKIHG